MYTDASLLGVSAVLTQTVDQVPHPIAYFSRKLTKAQRSYATIELELLAIISGLQAFSVYVGSGPITIFSDHNPIVWLKSSRTSNQRLLRWALCLSEYNLQIKHIKGSDTVLADWLSRNPTGSADSHSM